MGNLWDSVQRGLEKASQEAARIGRTQRLRSTIDTLSRQLNAQNNMLVSRAMELYTAGQLTQSELIPICQDLFLLKQQLEQAQNELKALHQQGPANQQGTTGPYPPQTQPPSGPYSGSGEAMQTVYAPPPPTPLPPTILPQGYPTFENTMPTPGNPMHTLPITPPPPPDAEKPTVSALDTLLLNTNDAGNTPSKPLAPKQQCPNCHAELIPGNMYCYNCGARAEISGVEHLPTMRGGRLEPFYPEGQETVRGATDAEMPLTDQGTVRSDAPSGPQRDPSHNDDPPADPQSRDGGL